MPVLGCSVLADRTISPRNELARLFLLDDKSIYPGNIDQTCGDSDKTTTKRHILRSLTTAQYLRYRSTLLTIVHSLQLLKMHFSRLLSLASLTALGTSQNTSLPDSPEPVAPGLTFLYTSLVECQNGLYTGPEGPRGIRTAIPILGGNVTGPRIKGTLPFFTLPSILTTKAIPAADTAQRRDSEPRCRLGINRSPDRHLQRRYSIQSSHARRSEHFAADFRTCAACRWLATSRRVRDRR